MTVGFHSPLPPAPTGVADYAAALLPALRRFGEIKVDADAASVNLYHLGNNALHLGIYRKALERPGVVVLHDAVLNHFFLSWLERPEYVAEFTHNYGEWYREFAGELWDSRAHSGADQRYFQYPMLRRLVETSRAVIVHNPAAARLVKAHSPKVEVHEIPHLWTPPPEVPAKAVEEFRRRLGLSRQSVLFGVFGYLRETKRLAVVMKAFHEAKRRGADAALLVAGRFVSPDLERSLAPWLGGAGVHRIDWLADGEFWAMAAATDVCVNLRYPSAGETSGIAIRLMGLGKTTILSATQESSAFPPDCYLPVEPGIAEEAELIEYMVLLARFPELAREIGGRAAVRIRQHHSVEAASESYWRILCACSN